MDLLAPPAHSSIGRPVGAWVGASVAVSGLWRVLGFPARSARAVARGSPLTAHRCLRSACWSRRERSSMRTFFSWSKCSKRLTFICRTCTVS